MLVLIWCVLKLMRRTGMRVPQIIRLNQLRFVWKMLVYGAILTASWLCPIYGFLGRLFSSHRLWWKAGSCIRDLLEQSGWPFGNSHITGVDGKAMRKHVNRTHSQRKGHTSSANTFSSTHLNITSRVYSQEQHFFSLSRFVWGLIHWI